MDLKQFHSCHADEGRWLHLCDPLKNKPIYLDDVRPSGDKDDTEWVPTKPVRFHLAGHDSKLYRNAQQAVVDARLEKALDTGSNKSAVDSAEVEFRRTVAACVLHWENFQEDGKLTPFSTEAVVLLFEGYPWVFEQISQFISRRVNFVGKASGS